jgi:hypothetical protein
VIFSPPAQEQLRLVLLLQLVVILEQDQLEH